MYSENVNELALRRSNLKNPKCPVLPVIILESSQPKRSLAKVSDDTQIAIYKDANPFNLC